MTKSRLTLSLDPRLQAGADVLSARQRRRTIVHTVIDAAAAVTAPFETIGAAGSDILSIRAGSSDDARTVSEAVAAAAGHMAVGLRFEDAPDASFAVRCIDEGATYLAGSPLGLPTVDAAADAA